MKTNYDRYVKSLWIKVYQDVLERSDDDYIEAKDMANQAVAHYMATFCTESTQTKEDFVTESGQVVKENFTTKEPSEIYMDGWNDREAKAEKELAAIREERDNYYDRLQELRAIRAIHHEVPFKIDEVGEVVMQGAKYEFTTVSGYCHHNHIDQTRIKRIWLEMKSEEEK